MFNLKDWWSWVFWIWMFGIIHQFVFYFDTLQRWKWGYWSIDLIPAVVLLIVLFIMDTLIYRIRNSKRVLELEEKFTNQQNIDGHGGEE